MLKKNKIKRLPLKLGSKERAHARRFKSAWRFRTPSAAGPPKTWMRPGGHSCRQNKKSNTLLSRLAAPREQSQANHKAFQRENKSVHRKRKSCRHLIDLLAGGQGRSFWRSTSLKMPSPRYIYGNMAVNTGKRKSTTFTVDSSKTRKEVLFTTVFTSMTRYSHS